MRKKVTLYNHKIAARIAAQNERLLSDSGLEDWQRKQIAEAVSHDIETLRAHGYDMRGNPVGTQYKPGRD